MKFVNLTPHEITIVRDNENVVIPPSGVIVRVTDKVEGLPDPRPEMIFLVSSLVAGRVYNRRDIILIPNDAVRDDCG